MAHLSLMSRLRKALSDIQVDMLAWLRTLPIEKVDKSGVVVLPTEPDYTWGKRTVAQSARQIELIRRFEDWTELATAITLKSAAHVCASFELNLGRIRSWVQLIRNHSLRPNLDDNEALLGHEFAEVDKVLEIFSHVGDKRLHVVPDTSAIIEESDPVAYSRFVGATEFVFVLVPNLLSELDVLKVTYKNDPLRDAAKKAIRRLADWMAIGNLPDGVAATPTIMVKSVAVEPCMKYGPNTLDPEVKDDRFIAAVLEFQRVNPAATVVIVSKDSNLVNKAHWHMISAVLFV